MVIFSTVGNTKESETLEMLICVETPGDSETCCMREYMYRYVVNGGRVILLARKDQVQKRESEGVAAVCEHFHRETPSGFHKGETIVCFSGEL